MATGKLKSTSFRLSHAAIASLDSRAKELNISKARLVEALLRHGRLPEPIKKRLKDKDI